jgi:hypothetical protein
MSQPSSNPSRQAMVTDPRRLAHVLQDLGQRYPEAHPQLVAALANAMLPDGTMTFTIRSLAREAALGTNLTTAYLQAARAGGWMALMGRDKDTGTMRYCAYQDVDVPAVPAPREAPEGAR